MAVVVANKRGEAVREATGKTRSYLKWKQEKEDGGWTDSVNIRCSVQHTPYFHNVSAIERTPTEPSGTYLPVGFVGRCVRTHGNKNR